ncbi:hypothetical protein HMPREF9446_02235 [Bacteroides fluxus YIT 12057]|uniref:Uncharacterized protein n=1 Tax=Bacteroides fluxus YIT 12057 TaxID=763034 RepID=F3PU15_9BACE|nr:hypothetical protein HMPREF9446_02235 [Bacteroides fluxus YIT 12057]
MGSLVQSAPEILLPDRKIMEERLYVTDLCTIFATIKQENR